MASTSQLNWTCIDSGALDAEENMRIDVQLLQNLVVSQTPLIRFYSWKMPTISYGYFLNPEKFLKMDVLEKNGFKIVRRPTGGGIVFHINDFTFSCVVPYSYPGYSTNTLENYALIHHIVSKVLSEALHENSYLLSNSNQNSQFCMASPVNNDVMIEGKKVAGGAQRRTKYGFLHQGTISLCSLDYQLVSSFLISRKMAKTMLATSFSSEKSLPILRAAIKSAFQRLLQ